MRGMFAMFERLSSKLRWHGRALGIGGVWLCSTGVCVCGAEAKAASGSGTEVLPDPVQVVPPVEVPPVEAPAAGVGADPSPSQGPVPSGAGSREGAGSIAETKQTPVEFLEAVGMIAKARWRQLYRPPPPTPAPDRARMAVTLGYLIGESYLCVHAGDAQQFRNNNQEVMTFCRTLGFGEKAAPMLLAQSKLAEEDQWEELKKQVVEGYQAMEQAMMDQRDEDLAILLRIAVWMRTLEIVSSLVLEAEQADVKGLCAGSPALVAELRNQFAALPERVKEESVAKELGGLLDFLWRTWGREEVVEPNAEMVLKTHERLAATARKVSLR